MSAQSLVRGSKFQGLVGSIEIQYFYNLESGSISFASNLLLLFNFVQKSNSESEGVLPTPELWVSERRQIEKQRVH